MLSNQIVFAAVLAITVASGLASVALVLIPAGRGRRAVAVRLAQIAVIGAAAIASLLRLT